MYLQLISSGIYDVMQDCITSDPASSLGDVMIISTSSSFDIVLRDFSSSSISFAVVSGFEGME